jgi:parvulin-like peptidyl-prolyl isomerase
MMARLLREPLVHFLGIGLALFLLYALLNPAGDEEIRVSAATVADLKAGHEKLWGRAPTQAQLDAMIAARVDDEILYREGLAMGLERDDAVVKRRVRQKYELIAEEEDAREPSEAELEAYLKAHPERFVAPPVVTFSQILLETEGTEAELRARAEAGLKALSAGAAPSTVGRPTLLPARTEAMPLDLVAREFGEGFAAMLAEVPTGSWQGPVPSGYGLHLVRLEARSVPAVPALDEVRAKVQREWENEARLKARAQRMAKLRARYDVVVEATP